MKSRVAPSTALESAIEELLSQGLSDAEHLAELGRLGARLVLQKALEEEVASRASWGGLGTSGRPRHEGGGMGCARVACRQRRGSAGTRPRSGGDYGDGAGKVPALGCTPQDKMAAPAVTPPSTPAQKGGRAGGNCLGTAGDACTTNVAHGAS